MAIVNCDITTCNYCIKNYCNKKNINLKNGKCPIAKQMKDMETAIQELKRAQQANNNALIMQNMDRIRAEVINRSYLSKWDYLIMGLKKKIHNIKMKK